MKAKFTHPALAVLLSVLLAQLLVRFSSGASLSVGNDGSGELTDGKSNVLTLEGLQASSDTTGFAVELTLFVSMSAKSLASVNAGQKLRELLAYQLNSLPGESVTRVQEVVIVSEQEADGDTAYGGEKCMKEAKAAGGGKGNGVYFTFQVTCDNELEAEKRKQYLNTDGALEHLNRAVAAYMGANVRLCRLLKPVVRAVLARDYLHDPCTTDQYHLLLKLAERIRGRKENTDVPQSTWPTRMIEKCKALLASKNLVMQVDTKTASLVCGAGWKIASEVMKVEISDVRASASNEQPLLFNVAKRFCSFTRKEFENKVIATLEDEELHEKRRFGVAKTAPNHCCKAHTGKGCADKSIAAAVCKLHKDLNKCCTERWNIACAIMVTREKLAYCPIAK